MSEPQEDQPKPDDQPLQPSNQKSSGCGGKGCLFSCLGVTVIGIAFMVGLFFVGRSYVETQLPVWKERYPEVEMALNAMEHIQLLREYASELQAMAEMMDDPNSGTVPSDIPSFDDPVDEQVQQMDGRLLIYQRLSLGAEEARAQLSERFESSGWELQSGDAEKHVWTRGSRTCDVEIDAVSGGSEIRSVCTR